MLFVKIIVDSKENIDKIVADAVANFVSGNKDAKLAFAAGETPKNIYEILGKSDVDFSKTEAFNICDYIGLSVDDERSCANQLGNSLYSVLGIKKVHSPDGTDEDSAAAYDEEIKAAGGIDLMLLGIGLNGHIGFNEPATLYDTHTHIARLTDNTKRMKAPVFGGAENVPDFGVTMGLKTICNAKNVFLVAYGEEKAEIIHKLVYGKTSTYVPAAMLQMHMNLTLYLDEAAASKLN